jgi:hypothetical protein
MPQESTNNATMVQPPHSSYFNHFFGALTGTLGSHPFRVLMNRAPYYTNPLKVFADFPRYWHTGIGLNLSRGITAVSLQSWSKTKVHHYYGHDTAMGKVAGWFAAASMGTFIATLVETPFIRKTTIAPGQQLSYMRYSVPLSSFFFTREAGFAAVVLSEKDLPKSVYYPLFIAATWITGMCHKFATWDATADIMSYKWKTPNFKRDGVVQTFKNIARGNVYDHPSCAVPYNNPVSNAQLLRNFSHVACHPNMFLFRFLLFTAYKICYNFGIQAAPVVKEEYHLASQSMFANRAKKDNLQQAVIVDNEMKNKI